MSLQKTISLLAAVLLVFAVLTARAQDPQQESSSKPPESPSKPAKPNDDMKPKPSSKQKKDSATQNAPDQPTWNPLRAEKDLEVGQYYMKKGDVDAAIDRFQDAALAKPGYAIPFRFLGEAQEKKGLKRDALKSYTRYLELYPRAEDKDKIEKKIEKLRSEVSKSNTKSTS